jgi:hypothetical protein
MVYNPLDDIGFQSISKGDRVTVTGDFELDFLEGRELSASSIITLMKDEGKAASESS